MDDTRRTACVDEPPCAPMMNRPAPSLHHPVLTREVVEWLAPRPGMTVVDCTVGAGGHSLALVPHLLPNGRLIALDCDAQALAMARQRLAEFAPCLHLVHENFRHLPDVLARLGLSQVHGLIADLGMSSLHVDDPARGFSVRQEGPLDMRMDARHPTTAAALIRQLSEHDLARLLQTYGEERWARRIAKRIVAARRTQSIETTTQLARLVTEAVPRGGASRRLHPATRTFQALRIAVNEELAALGSLLAVVPQILAPGGRAVIIAFHSLEDRLVKQAFRRAAQTGLVRLLTKKPLRPSAPEVAENPRSRSAKLRAVERL